MQAMQKKWTVLTLAAVTAFSFSAFAGEPDAKVADAIAQIEARRTDKLNAEAKSVEARAERDTEQGAQGGGGGQKMKRRQAPAGEKKD